jgi:hypothetical protein
MHLVDGYLSPLALKMKSAEMAGIALVGTRRGRTRGHIEWTVAPDDAGAIEELRDTIKSKMGIANCSAGS